MSEAQELLDAAEKVDAALEGTTEGPWWFDESDMCWRLHGVAFRVPPQMGGEIPEQVMNKQILKAAKRNTPYAEYWPEPADAAWIILTNPVMGAPLRDSFRQHADEHSTYDCDRPDCALVALARVINAAEVSR